MKIRILTPALLAYHTLASPGTENQLRRLDREIQNQQDVLTKNVILRAFNPVDVAVIASYGCYCQFTNEYPKRGDPVDDFDTACKILEEGYTCMKMELGDTCNIETETYISAYGGGFGLTTISQDTLIAGCEAANFTPCKQSLCKVEGYFIQTILGKVFKDRTFPNSPAYDARMGFSHSATCKAKEFPPGGRGYDRVCCGNYPRKFPYRHSETDRKCCQGKTYNPTFFACCEDGSVGITCDE